jgi:hypothetical protein
MASRLLTGLRRRLCCPPPPPPRVTGLVAQTGAGSGEVVVAWDRLPGSARVAVYRVYRRVAPGVWRPLAAVESSASDPGFPGKVALIDFAGAFPGGGSGGGDEDGSGARTYVVAALGASGLEGPWSAPAAGSPP